MDALLIDNLHISDIASAIHYCSFYPKQTYGYAFIFSLTGYLGIQVSHLFYLICRTIWLSGGNFETGGKQLF
jgi:hypothetical protein